MPSNPPPGAAQKLRRSVQLVFQNPHASLNPRRQIGAILEEPLAINTPIVQAPSVKRGRSP